MSKIILALLTIVFSVHCYTKHVVFLEGPQGSGKTYFANHLPHYLVINEQTHHLIHVEEPYDNWSESGIIHAFKTNFKEYTPLFQSAIMSSLSAGKSHL
jgi:hypothetical protein